MAHILTGTWEEIKAHEAELAGHRVTVTVEDEIVKDSIPETRMAAALAWLSKPRETTAVLIDDSREVIYGYEKDRG